MYKYNLHRIVQKEQVYDMNQIGKTSLLSGQALETMWLYTLENNGSNRYTQNKEYHIHSCGRQLRHKLKRCIKFTSHKIKSRRYLKIMHRTGVETHVLA